MTAEEAARLVAKMSGHYTAAALLRSSETISPAFRLAARKGRSAERFPSLQTARQVLERHHGFRK